MINLALIVLKVYSGCGQYTVTSPAGVTTGATEPTSLNRLETVDQREKANRFSAQCEDTLSKFQTALIWHSKNNLTNFRDANSGTFLMPVVGEVHESHT